MLRRRLILGVLVTAPRDWKRLRDALEQVAADLDMQVEVDRGTGDNRSRPEGRTHVTVLGSPLKSRAVAAIAGRIADTGANIDRIERMARYPVTAIELHVSGADPDRLRAVLAQEAALQEVDVAVQPANLLRRGDAAGRDGRRLDADPGRGDRDARRARRLRGRGRAGHRGGDARRAGLRAESLRQRVALLAGLDAGALDEVYDEVVLAPGARTLVRTLQAARLPVRDRLRRLHPDHRPARRRPRHRLLAPPTSSRWSTARSPGASSVTSSTGPARPQALRRFAAEAGVAEEATVAIGDGANDLDMLSAAGLGIAFNAKPVVQEAADTSVNVPYLDAIMYLLGITREEIEARRRRGTASSPPLPPSDRPRGSVDPSRREVSREPVR